MKSKFYRFLVISLNITLISSSFLFSTGSALAAVGGVLRVSVNVINNDGGISLPADFIIHINGANAAPASFYGNAAGTAVTVDPNTPFTASVSTARYEASFSPACNASLTEGTSADCTVTLDDIASLLPGQNPPNLISNPSVETSAGSIPLDWLTGEFGTNTPAFTYPSPGSNGGVGAKVAITTYTSGDAKWYFTPVVVLSGHQYAFSDNYNSNIPSELVADFLDSGQNHLSFAFASVPLSAGSWATSSATFLVPPDATYLTVYHRIQAVGEITVDDYRLTLAPQPLPLTQGFVSLTFDDGLISQFNNAVPKLASAGLKGTFYIFSHVIPGLSIINPSVETASGSEPLGWSKSGSPDATYAYLTNDGHSGSHAVRVSASSSGSNAAWSFDPVTTLNDYVYSYTEWYKSDTDSSLVGLLTMSDNSIVTADVTTATGTTTGTSVDLGSSGNSWTPLQTYFYVPPTAKALTVAHRLTGTGELTVDDVALGIDGYMTAEDILLLQSGGQEIGGHTQTHANLTALPADRLVTEVSGGRQDLLAGGLTPVTTFDYPYGAFNPEVIQSVKDAGFTTARSVLPGFNGQDADNFALLSQSVNSDTSINQIQAWVDQARADREWLILVFHNITTDLTNLTFGTTPAILQSTLDYLTLLQVPVKTMSEGPAFGAAPVDRTPPIITLNGNSTTTLAIGQTYTDSGATALDDIDGNLTASIATSTDVAINTSVAGTFHEFYNVADAAGNPAATITRTVVISALEVSAEQQANTGSNSITIAWTTSHAATSRVIWDIVSHSDASTTEAGLPPLSDPNYGYANSTVEDSAITTSHSVPVNGLVAATTYYFRAVSHGSPETVGAEIAITTSGAPSGGSGSSSGGGGSTPLYLLQASQQPQPQPLPEPIPNNAPLVLGEKLADNTETVTAAEAALVANIDLNLVKRLAGRLLLQVQQLGQVWYLDPLSLKKYYLPNGTSAYQALRQFGLGITNADLAKIPVGYETRFVMTDNDQDGLPDKFEEALGTNPLIADTDQDGVSDGMEVLTNFTNPLGSGKLVKSSTLVNRLSGRILLQVQSRGEAWYVNPVDGKRYYMNTGEAAYQIMKYLSLGITNQNLRKIPVGSLTF